MSSLHLNHASTLPPTDTPLLILIPSSGALLEVKRTSHVSNREHDLEYVTENGTIITGRYRWTYP
ncbi:MAG: hypothetical protein RBR22_09815 [Desulfuromonas sp.]|nr:hypothetical protein [Desulfuromonas sp.]